MSTLLKIPENSSNGFCYKARNLFAWNSEGSVHGQRDHLEAGGNDGILKCLGTSPNFQVNTQKTFYCRVGIVCLAGKGGFDRGAFSFVTFLWASKEK